MPALDPGDLVLLTDASGVLGTHLLTHLAGHGFRLRVAGDAPAGVETTPIDWTVVSTPSTQLTQAGAYRAATAGVDGIVVPLDGPLAEAHVRALLSALPGRLKRIVAISSTGAISTEAGLHGADEWNTDAVEIHRWHTDIEKEEPRVAALGKSPADTLTQPR
jgi:uncharacterized protein YbjT (DUF2867 family)